MRMIRKGIRGKDMTSIQARKIKWCKKCNTPLVQIVDGKYVCLVCDRVKKGGEDAITK